MLLDKRQRHVCNRRIVIRDARVGDDDVQVVEAMLGLKGLDCIAWVGLGFGVDFHNDEIARGVFGEGGEGSGGGMKGIPDASNDGGIGAREVGGDEALADT